MPNPDKKYWGISDISSYLSITRTTALKLIATEGFPVIIIENEKRKSYRVNRDDFYKWIANNMGKTIVLKDIKLGKD